MKASQRRDDTGQPGAQRCPLSSQEWTFGNANKCPLWVISGHVHCKTSCPLYPRKRTCAVQLQMSALGQKRTSANTLRSCPTCFSWAVLQALELADDARLTFTIALHGKHAWERLVEDSHRYHSISHGWGPLTIRTTGKMPSRPLAKGERGRAFKAISPGMLPPLGIIFGLFFRVHWAIFIHGNEVSPGNLCREPAAVA
jgi:hypothetical protein